MCQRICSRKPGTSLTKWSSLTYSIFAFSIHPTVSFPAIHYLSFFLGSTMIKKLEKSNYQNILEKTSNRF